MFALWDMIFQLPSAKQERVVSVTGKADEAGDSATGSADRKHTNKMLSMLSAHGEYERLLQGCFEAFPKQRLVDISTDPSKTRINQLLDYITGFHDVLSQRVNLSMNWELAGYMPYVFSVFHQLFAATNRLRVEWPRKDYEAYVATKMNENILQLMQKGLAPKARLSWNIKNVAMELVSPLVRIMSPELRPVNVQLMKSEERRTLKKLINIMISLGLLFKQEKAQIEDRKQAGQISSDGNWIFCLEP